MNQNSHTFSGKDVDYPLSFWENGPVRIALENELEAALIDHCFRRGISLSPEQEHALYERVLPQAFDFVMHTMHWVGQQDEAHIFTTKDLNWLKAEIAQLVLLQFPHDASQGEPRHRRRFFRTSLWLPRAVFRLFFAD